VTESSIVLPVLNDCWNSIGVKGDRSCHLLPKNVHCQNCPTFASAAQALLDRPPPKGYVAELTVLLNSTAAAANQKDSLSALVFEIGGQLLAIDTKAVVEVTGRHPVHRVAHRSSRVFSGVVNIHGQLELAASLSGLLQLSGATQTEQPAASRMVLMEHVGQRWVFAVDATHGVRRFHPDHVLPPPSTTQHDVGAHVKQILCWDERRIGLIDLDRACLTLERALR
jgi:chemotaxis-related protein WspD